MSVAVWLLALFAAAAPCQPLPSRMPPLPPDSLAGFRSLLGPGPEHGPGFALQRLDIERTAVVYGFARADGARCVYSVGDPAVSDIPDPLSASIEARLACTSGVSVADRAALGRALAGRLEEDCGLAGLLDGLERRATRQQQIRGRPSQPDAFPIGGVPDASHPRQDSDPAPRPRPVVSFSPEAGASRLLAAAAGSAVSGWLLLLLAGGLLWGGLRDRAVRVETAWALVAGGAGWLLHLAGGRPGPLPNLIAGNPVAAGPPPGMEWLGIASGWAGLTVPAAGLLGLLLIVSIVHAVGALTGDRRLARWAGLVVAVSPVHQQLLSSETFWPALTVALSALVFGLARLSRQPVRSDWATIIPAAGLAAVLLAGVIAGAVAGAVAVATVMLARRGSTVWPAVAATVGLLGFGVGMAAVPFFLDGNAPGLAVAMAVDSRMSGSGSAYALVLLLPAVGVAALAGMRRPIALLAAAIGCLPLYLLLGAAIAHKGSILPVNLRMLTAAVPAFYLVSLAGVCAFARAAGRPAGMHAAMTAITSLFVHARLIGWIGMQI